MRIRSLLTAMGLIFLVGGNCFALSLMNSVPAVRARVVDVDGNAVAGAVVRVDLLGTDDSVFNDEKEVYSIKEITGTSDKDGYVSLEKATVNLGHLKSKFIGAEITITAPGYNAQKLQAVNLRVLGGALGAFVVGLVDAQGEDFNKPFLQTLPYAYKVMKDSKFSRVYKKLLSEPIRLKKSDGSSRRTGQFEILYKD